MGLVYRRKSARTGKPLRNYSIDYFDHTGKRIVESARTSDKRIAERILKQKESEVALIRAGAVDLLQERFKQEATKLASDHLDDYLEACKDKQAAHGLKQKRRHLAWLLDATGAVHLSDILPDVLDARLGGLSEKGMSARSINLKLECANAFLNWCVRNGRLRHNPLKIVPRRNEVLGRVRERRALSRDECRRLLAVAREQAQTVRGAKLRPLWYLLALRAGLRRGDLERLTWGAVDLDRGTLTIRGGKVKRRIDVLPLSRDLREEFRQVWPTAALPSARVFPQPVSNETRKRDFVRAGIELVNDRDEHADLHALRVTFGTELALSGTPPAIHQKLMRHCTIELTMRYYTKLGIDDLDQRGIDLLPSVEAVDPTLPEIRREAL
jgi:integrase